MVEKIAGLFIVAHGLVHLWMVTLSLKLVPFKPEMGWNGKSWLLTNTLGDSLTRTLAAIMLVIATLGLSVGGVALTAHAKWSHPVLLVSAILSAVTLIVFWDGSFEMIVEKGLIGLLISIGIVIAVLIF
jgi:hypothetical protein